MGVLDLTQGNRADFLEAADLFDLEREVAWEFAKRIRAKSFRGDEGRNGVRITIRGAGPDDADEVIEVLPNWAGRVVAEVVRETKRPLEQTQGRTMRLCLKALWAFYALRFANGNVDARVTFR